MTDRQIIVVAWAEKTRLVPTGRYVTRDRNAFPEMRAEWEGRACMWLNRGTPADVDKAKAWAATEGRTVHVYPTTEKDPLGKARESARLAAL